MDFSPRLFSGQYLGDLVHGEILIHLCITCITADDVQQSFQKVYPHLGNLVGLPPKFRYFLRIS